MEKPVETYVNGQIKQMLDREILTFYFKNGKVKAKGPFIQGKMEGRWEFFRESGELWQTGEFSLDLKHGEWIRYDRAGQVEYRERFAEGRIQKRG